MKLDNEKLEIAMAEQGVIYKDLCERAGLSDVGLRKIRTGERNPKPATIGKIAKALGVPVQNIIGEGE